MGVGKLHRLLKEKTASLSEDEYMVCLLVRFNFIPSEISILLNLSSQTVTNIRTRLLKKLFGKMGGAKDFDQALIEYTLRDRRFGAIKTEQR